MWVYGFAVLRRQPTRVTTVAPRSGPQTVDTDRGRVQQLLRRAAVPVPPASAAGPLHIAGRAVGGAARLVEQLTATTQATPGDAT